jgi:hypothetical protein
VEVERHARDDRLAGFCGAFGGGLGGGDKESPGVALGPACWGCGGGEGESGAEGVFSREDLVEGFLV